MTEETVSISSNQGIRWKSNDANKLTMRGIKNKIYAAGYGWDSSANIGIQLWNGKRPAKKVNPNPRSMSVRINDDLSVVSVPVPAKAQPVNSMKHMPMV
jgi:hypothetical protein